MHQSPAVKQQKEPGFAEKAAKLEEKKQAQQQEVIDAPSGSDPSKLTPTAKPKQKKSKGGAGGNKKSGGAERWPRIEVDRHKVRIVNGWTGRWPQISGDWGCSGAVEDHRRKKEARKLMTEVDHKRKTEVPRTTEEAHTSMEVDRKMTAEVHTLMEVNHNWKAAVHMSMTEEVHKLMMVPHTSNWHHVLSNAEDPRTDRRLFKEGSSWTEDDAESRTGFATSLLRRDVSAAYSAPFESSAET
ncbi:unnamed protein product [Notodromas monacha]|uniref:Uncharacterized protein n=1 Tax=Notodromas monacha TaxID=399045 RepID=A0A7R9BRG8_9CRUS|nr:unnamed protein product [Notodromas monacha]CAG0919406.1 unnamed protein product [Notodromas monacha]